LSQALIQKTAKRLFTSETVGGTFAENGAWQTNTPTQEALFKIRHSKYLSHCKTHLSHISDIKMSQSELASILDTDYQGLVSHLNEKSISELSMAECRALEDKISSQLDTIPRNEKKELAPNTQHNENIRALINGEIALNKQIDNLKEQN